MSCITILLCFFSVIQILVRVKSGSLIYIEELLEGGSTGSREMKKHAIIIFLFPLQCNKKVPLD